MSMIQQADFLRNYNLNSAEFNATNLNPDELLNISSDFESKRAAYDEIGTGIVKILFKFDAVHAIKYQVKNSEELIQYIVAHKTQHPDLTIDLHNYEQLIENLISIRIIPLFKSDWAKIHESIVDKFVTIGEITANVRAEDSAATIKGFTDKGFSVKTQADGYRSVDYVIKTAPSKKEYKVAVQVRNIFEEGWAEIDHSARYQNKMDDVILNEFSKTLNKLASGADEMGEFIHGLKSYLLAKETLVQEQQNQLADLKAQLAQANQEKKALEKKEEEVLPDTEKIPSHSAEGMIGKSIIEDLAKTAAGIDGGSVPIAAATEQTQAQTEVEQLKSAIPETTPEEKPKTVKNRTDKPKIVKAKDEKTKEEKVKEEIFIPIVEDLFGQTRIPDAPPLKPSTANV